MTPVCGLSTQSKVVLNYKLLCPHENTSYRSGPFERQVSNKHWSQLRAGGKSNSKTITAGFQLRTGRGACSRKILTSYIINANFNMIAPHNIEILMAYLAFM